MDLKAFEHIVKTENIARRYLVKRCWKNYRRFCIRCRSKNIYRIIGKRFRCKACEYTFHDFSGRWINRLHISSRQWLWIIKLFELELPALRICQQLDLSYPTVHKAIRVIRLAIFKDGQTDDLLSGEIELDEAYFGGRRKGKPGRGAANKTPVFGILERNGIVKVQIVKNVTAQTLIDQTIKTVRRGSIVYTDKFKSYDTLMFCGYRHLKIDHKKRFASGKVYMNGIEGFWSFAKKRLIKYHGVSKNWFPLYLKELEFRYNYRKHSKFDLIADYVTNLVPNRL